MPMLKECRAVQTCAYSCIFLLTLGPSCPFKRTARLKIILGGIKSCDQWADPACPATYQVLPSDYTWSRSLRYLACFFTLHLAYPFASSSACVILASVGLPFTLQQICTTSACLTTFLPLASASPVMTSSTSSCSSASASSHDPFLLMARSYYRHPCQSVSCPTWSSISGEQNGQKVSSYQFRLY